MVATPLVFLGVSCTHETYEALRRLVRMIGRTATRRLVTSFEANPPVGVEQVSDWVRAADDRLAVRRILIRWIRARLDLPAST